MRRPAVGDGAIAAAVFLCALALIPLLRILSAYWSAEEWYLFDDGTIAYAAFRSSLGEIPHVDFSYFYSGGAEILLGLVFRIAGASLSIAQTALGVVMASTIAILYLLHRRLQINRPTSLVSSFVWGAGAFMLNYHLFPAWPAQMLVLAAVFLVHSEKPDRQWRHILLAGILLGFASSMKQTLGLYAAASIVLTMAIVPALPDDAKASGGRRTLASSWRVQAAEGLSIGTIAAVPAAFLYILRTHMTIVNMLFLLVPVLAIAVFALRRLSGSSNELSHSGRAQSSFMRRVLFLGTGFAAGFSVIVVYYAIHGGLASFVSESFLQVQSMTTRHFAGFDAARLDLAQPGMTTVRRILVFLIPLGSASAGLAMGMSMANKRRTEPSARLLIGLSVLLIVLNFTLYPNPIKYLLVTLLPVAALPVTFILERMLTTRLSNALVRTAVIGVILTGPIVGYLGFRSLAGDLSTMISPEIARIDVPRGNSYLPRPTAEAAETIVRYLNSRPADETFVAYDLQNKTYAFLAGRQVEIDYGQKFNFFSQGDADIEELRNFVDERRIDIVIFARAYLRGTAAEHELFAALDHDYLLVISNPTHLIFQRKPGGYASMTLIPLLR